ncbi:ABC transporter substrate-binding protein [Ammoniphilus sp. 3BR4]|uniref:ABC transporter substrate-binding protein n=1 Tax=Ammoniphilus sp. 3BR4 TaxID=3158265 RepID=UPI00346511C7
MANNNQSKIYNARKMINGVLLSSLLTAALTACGSSDTSGSPNSSSSSSEGSDVIKVVQITPFSGAGASFGEWEDQAFTMAIENVNADGGIHGRKIEIEKVDSQSNPTIAVNLAQKMVNDDVVAAFATPLSTTTLAVLEVFKQAKVPHLTGGQDPVITSKGSDYIFRYNANSRAYTKTAADYVVNKKGWKKLAVISNSGAYGKGERDTFVEALKSFTVTPVVEEVVTPDAKDFTAQLTNIKNANPEVLYIGAENIQSGLIVKQARALGMNAQIVGGSTLGSPVYVETAGVDVAEGTIFTTQFIANSTEETRAFSKAFKEKYGIEANFNHAKAYDGAMMLIEAMNKAYPNIDGESIRNALREINFHGLTGDYKFDETGEGSEKAQMGIIKNGKPEVAE